MKRVFSALVVIASCLCLIGCGDKAHEELTDDRARELLSEHYESLGKNVSDYDLYDAKIEHLDEKTSVVRVRDKMTSTTTYNGWVVYRGGTVTPLRLETLVLLFQRKFPAKTDEEKEQLITQLLEYLCYNGPGYRFDNVINSTNDIQGYGNSPLDVDLHALVREPYTSEDGKVWVQYSYSQMGGTVFRTRFEFDDDGRLLEVLRTIIATKVGAYTISI